MIRLLIILLIFLPTLQSYCQSFAPIGATWYYGSTEGMNSGSLGYVKHESYKDTTINLKKCRVIRRKVFGSVGTTNTIPDVYILQENGKVYQYIRGKFYVLYDFTAKKGDTLTTPKQNIYGYDTTSTVKYIVDSVGIKIINGIPLKFYTIRGSMTIGWLLYGTVSEYLGHDVYMFAQQGLGCDVGCFVGLRCYNDNLINFSSATPCTKIINSVVNLNADLFLFKVFPNPVDDLLNVEVPNSQAECNFLLYNVYGQIQQSFKLNGRLGHEKLEVNLKNLETGIYFLNGFINGHFSTTKIIKK